MENILDAIISNNALFACVIIVLSAILVTLIVLIIRSLRDNKKINIYEEELEDEDIKKVKNVKKEDIIDSPDTEEEIENIEEMQVDNTFPTEEELEDIDEEEIKERYDEENEREIEELLEENDDNEIGQLIKEMEESTNVKPEDVVANFEKEQEAQSIISYKELVDAVKNRQNEYYEDELESKPLTTVSDFIKQKEEKKQSTQTILANMLDASLEDEQTSESEQLELDNTDSDDNVSNVNLDAVEIDDDLEFEVGEAETVGTIGDIYQQMAEDIKKESEATSVIEDLTKNEEFLQSLKDFRKKL